MKKTLMMALLTAMLTTSTYAAAAPLNTQINKEIVIVETNGTATSNAVKAETNSSAPVAKAETSIGVKALAVVAAPVILVGAVVYAVVMAPIWIVSKLAGK